MSNPIFTISGLRGIVGKELTPELVTTTAAGFAAFAGGGKIALGHDCRTSAEMLVHACSAGLVGSGCEVLDLGICPTPTIPLLVSEEKLNGGIMITASHNPPAWNGLKFVSPLGALLSDAELKVLKRILRWGDFERQPWDRLGSVQVRGDAVDIHIRRILRSPYFRNRPRRKLRVGIDACNGAASRAATKLVQELGSHAFEIFCSPQEGGRFPRQPEPTADHLSALSELVRRRKLDLGAAFDPDGDRFSCVDERGNPLGEEASVMLATEFVLMQSPGPVVVNLSTTQAIDEIAARHGAPVFRTRVGEAAVVARMKELGAVVGGEGNGGVIIPAINAGRDGLVALATVVQAVSDAGKPLSAIAQGLPRYAMVKDKVRAFPKAGNATRKRLQREFAGAEFDSTDGLKILGQHWWLHVRPSNTEPIIRLIAEAGSESQARRLIKRAKKTLSELV